MLHGSHACQCTDRRETVHQVLQGKAHVLALTHCKHEPSLDTPEAPKGIIGHLSLWSFQDNAKLSSCKLYKTRNATCKMLCPNDKTPKSVLSNPSPLCICSAGAKSLQKGKNGNGTKSNHCLSNHRGICGEVICGGSQRRLVCAGQVEDCCLQQKTRDCVIAEGLGNRTSSTLLYMP